MSNKYRKSMFSTVPYRDMQVRATMQHFIVVRIIAIKNKQKRIMWQIYGEKGDLIHCWKDYKLVQYHGEIYAAASKI